MYSSWKGHLDDLGLRLQQLLLETENVVASDPNSHFNSNDIPKLFIETMDESMNVSEKSAYKNGKEIESPSSRYLRVRRNSGQSGFSVAPSEWLPLTNLKDLIMLQQNRIDELERVLDDLGIFVPTPHIMSGGNTSQASSRRNYWSQSMILPSSFQNNNASRLMYSQNIKSGDANNNSNVPINMAMNSPAVSADSSNIINNLTTFNSHFNSHHTSHLNNNMNNFNNSEFVAGPIFSPPQSGCATSRFNETPHSNTIFLNRNLSVGSPQLLSPLSCTNNNNHKNHFVQGGATSKMTSNVINNLKNGELISTNNDSNHINNHINQNIVANELKRNVRRAFTSNSLQTLGESCFAPEHSMYTQIDNSCEKEMENEDNVPESISSSFLVASPPNELCLADAEYKQKEIEYVQKSEGTIANDRNVLVSSSHKRRESVGFSGIQSLPSDQHLPLQMKSHQFLPQISQANFADYSPPEKRFETDKTIAFELAEERPLRSSLFHYNRGVRVNSYKQTNKIDHENHSRRISANDQDLTHLSFEAPSPTTVRRMLNDGENPEIKTVMEDKNNQKSMVASSRRGGWRTGTSITQLHEDDDDQECLQEERSNFLKECTSNEDSAKIIFGSYKKFLGGGSPSNLGTEMKSNRDWSRKLDEMVIQPLFGIKSSHVEDSSPSHGGIGPFCLPLYHSGLSTHSETSPYNDQLQTTDAIMNSDSRLQREPVKDKKNEISIAGDISSKKAFMTMVMHSSNVQSNNQNRNTTNVESRNNGAIERFNNNSKLDNTIQRNEFPANKVYTNYDRIDQEFLDATEVHKQCWKEAMACLKDMETLWNEKSHYR